MAPLFWLAIATIAYAYAGYPIALRLLAAVRSRPVRRADAGLSVSVIVTVHNGAAAIRGKLLNLLEQDYPPGLLEILVADDASDDGTDGIVGGEFGPRGVRLVRLPERGGKERAQQTAVAQARGDVLVFTDVGTRLDRTGIRTLARSFADPSVGAVSSEDRLDGAAGGEGGYVGYEMSLRRLESRVGSIVGLSGSLFAARREVCAGFSDRLASDFRTALEAVRAGKRAVADEEAVGYYTDVAGSTREFDRKVRTVVRGMTVFFAEASLLNPLRYGLFSWQLASHKLARWLVPWAMLVALVASAVGARSSKILAAALAAQLLGYAAAGIRVRAARYLVEVNLAIFVAWLRFLRGDRIVLWSPSKR